MTQQKEYYSITNKLYSLQNANEFDFSIMATLATFNYPFVSDDNGKTTEIKIKPFKVSDIYNALSFSNANRNRKFIHSKIEKSIIKLAKADIIQIDEVLKSDGRENTFIAKQIVDAKGQFTGFASINADEYFNVVLRINKDGEKIKALACYVSIIQRIFKTAKDELAKQAKFNISSLNYYINWESQETIGNKYGMGRKAVAKSIDLLVEVEAIASKKVKLKGKSNKEEKLIFSKYSDAEKLDLYVQEQIEKGEYTKVVKAKVAKEIVEDEVVEVAEEVADEQVQTLLTYNADEIVKERTEQVETVDTVEKKEDKQKVININDDERIKRMQALASFENVKNVDEREEESKASVDLLAGHRPEKSAEA